MKTLKAFAFFVGMTYNDFSVKNALKYHIFYQGEKNASI